MVYISSHSKQPTGACAALAASTTFDVSGASMSDVTMPDCRLFPSRLQYSGTPAVCKQSATRFVVVVLPFVPEITATGFTFFARSTKTMGSTLSAMAPGILPAERCMNVSPPHRAARPKATAAAARIPIYVTSRISPQQERGMRPLSLRVILSLAPMRHPQTC